MCSLNLLISNFLKSSSNFSYLSSNFLFKSLITFMSHHCLLYR
ncbi:hypothetical protein LDVICp001 [lymphocystis disease virus-China]|uniref:Uncharacterized protein n=1 Tax=lymphocystis disease virus-China TaxID=256729 RepID=Q678K7_9VIRU|nr:hypothetical protein LDVICp001 [lymphocystis disease virus-China]AAU10850.1 hypothetical protein [lymphocystis disease virus-China]